VFTGKYNSAFGGGGSTYAYYHEEDESSFQLVDTQKIQKPIYTRGRRMFQQVSFKFVSHKSFFPYWMILASQWVYMLLTSYSSV